MPDVLVSLLSLDPDILRMAFVLGVVVAALMYDRLHLTTGSIVVPGYLGVGVLHPALIFMTFAGAFAVFWVVYKMLPNYFLMSGRSKFLLAASFSAVLQFLILEISGLSAVYWNNLLLVGAIGFVIPGLIAHDFSRHGIVKTLATTTVAGFIVALAVVIALLLLSGSVVPVSPLQLPRLTFDIRWLGLALTLSVLAAAALQYNYGLRAGGFVGGGYLAIVLVSLPDLVYLAALSLTTYYLVTRFLMNSELILFGQRKFAIMMLCSVVLSWGILQVIERGLGYTGLIASFMPMAGIFLPGLYANDMERVGIAKVVIGTSLVVAFTLPMVLLCIELFGEHRTQPMISLGLLSACTGILIFARSVPARLAHYAA